MVKDLKKKRRNLKKKFKENHFIKKRKEKKEKWKCKSIQFGGGGSHALNKTTPKINILKINSNKSTHFYTKIEDVQLLHHLAQLWWNNKAKSWKVIQRTNKTEYQKHKISNKYSITSFLCKTVWHEGLYYCIKDEQEAEYRMVVDRFVERCEMNKLLLNVSKNKELMVDYSIGRVRRGNPAHLHQRRRSHIGQWL